ncbi:MULTISPECIES: hypothetical protein [Pseudofrankia]|nr:MULTISPECIES: hypothetical protein [Pseudofrankia]
MLTHADGFGGRGRGTGAALATAAFVGDVPPAVEGPVLSDW